MSLRLCRHDDELVATDAREGVCIAQPAGQAAGNFAQQLVSCFVAARVVDDLQAVDVYEQQREPAGRAAQPGERLGQPVVE